MSKEQGIVKFFHAQKGYGFVTPAAGGKDLFFHVTNTENNGSGLAEGVSVTFVVTEGRKGPEATEVRLSS